MLHSMNNTAKVDSQNYFAQLPREIQLYILLLAQLTVPELTKVLPLVSKKFKSIVEDEAFWKPFFKQDLATIKKEKLERNNLSAKEIFLTCPGYVKREHLFFHRAERKKFYDEMTTFVVNLEKKINPEDEIKTPLFLIKYFKNQISKWKPEEVGAFLKLEKINRLLQLFDEILNSKYFYQSPGGSNFFIPTSVEMVLFFRMMSVKLLSAKDKEKVALLNQPECLEKIWIYLRDTHSGLHSNKLMILAIVLGNKQLVENENLHLYMDTILKSLELEPMPCADEILKTVAQLELQCEVGNIKNRVGR